MKCIKCFKEYINEEKCPHCGFDNSQYVADIQCLNPGSTLKDSRYEIGCVVGVGGFGITYSAWDSTLDIRVAIKEYLPGEFSTRLSNAGKVTIYGGDKEQQFKNGLDKFYDESTRLAEFEGIEGVVQIYDVFKENNTAYIVMEYLEGETLGDRLKREGKLSVEESLDIIIPVLNALESVHAKGIVHRDIAPNNIFITNERKIKLLDFGAARNATGTHSKSLTVLYKEGYTAEEQYQSRGKQGPWTDVYSSAATLYRMITGEVPQDAMQRIRRDQIKKPSKCGIKISGNIENAIMNALVMDYNKRTQSAEAFKEELQSVKRVGKRFRRLREYKVGRIPIKVRVLAGMLVISATVIAGLIYGGVIHFEMDAFANLFLASGRCRVINVVNLSEGEAEQKLAELGLNLVVTDVIYSKEAESGRVLSQDEKKGTVVDVGSDIHVVVVRFPENVVIPDFAGMEVDKASGLIADLGLKYEISEEMNIEAPGYIFEQYPEKDELLEQGETVRLTISAGMDFDESLSGEIGDYTRMNLGAAREFAAELGVYVHVIGREYDNNVKKNYIVSQSVPAGTSSADVDVIDVVLSLGESEIDNKDEVKLISHTSSDGDWEKYEYDENGHEIYYEDSDGYWRKSEYNEEGLRTFCEYSDGDWTRNTYDATGQLVYSEHSDERWEKYEYDENGREIYFETSGGYWRKSEYSINGREVYCEDSEIGDYTFIYDINMNMICEKSNEETLCVYDYDEYGNLLYRQDADGSWMKSEYDIYGNELRCEWSDGELWECEYDEYGRLIKETIYLVDDYCAYWVDEYEYDSEGNLISNTWRQVYDDGTSIVDETQLDIYGNSVYNLRTFVNANGYYWDVKNNKEKVYYTNVYSDGTETSADHTGFED